MDMSGSTIVTGGKTYDTGVAASISSSYVPIIVYSTFTSTSYTVSWAKQISTSDNTVNAVKISSASSNVYAVLGS